ncbi:MAG TPA: DUF6782 family putative metallopeptidase [Patescibacteria group bacterium]|nr:DUF6782 family putative metallopeptidase [Patescibacteria group bacterium]
MLSGTGDKRIRVRLFTIVDGEPYLAPVEERERAFVGYIRNLVKILEQSPLGRMLVRSAMLHHVSVGLDPMLEAHASFFYPGQNHFDLGYQPELLQKSEKGVARYLVSFIGSLRRAWHHHSGRGPDVALAPDDFLKVCRCEEADIEAVIHLVAWELRSGGASFLWRHLLSGPNGDVSVVFERAMDADPSHQFDGEALKAAFNQWFAERERINACDHFALEMIDLALVQNGMSGGVGIARLREGMIEGIGVMPGGQNYLAGMPFNSTWYNGLDDEFNRVHLRHIKQDIRSFLQAQDSRR